MWFFILLRTILKEQINKKNINRKFIDFCLRGLQNRNLFIKDTPYKFLIRDTYEHTIREIMQSQEVCSLSALAEINEK